MTAPTNDNRDTDRTENIATATTATAQSGQSGQRLDLSATKVAAGACASALAAAVGSKLGVAGTIAGAAVASAVATSASAVIGHSLERGKTAARKAIPVLDPEQLETALLSRARAVRARAEGPAALTGVDEAPAMPSPSLADRALADGALDETVALDGRTHATMGPHPQTMLLQHAEAEAPRTRKLRIPARKRLIAAGLASFLLGTGGVTALEVARKGEFPGYHSNVFTNDPNQGHGSHNQPVPERSGGGGTRGRAPSQGADSTAGTPAGPGSGSESGSGSASGSGPDSGTGSSSPSSVPSMPSGSGSTASGPGTPGTPSTGPSGGSSGATGAPTSPAGGASTTAPPSSAGSTAPGSAPGGGSTG